MALVFNAWTIYKSNFERSKKYWNRIYIKLDLVMKRRAMRKWRKQAQKKLESELQGT